MISPFITPIPLRIPFPTIRPALTPISSSSTTTIYSIPSLISSSSTNTKKTPKPTPISFRERLQSLQFCQYLDAQCPTHSQSCGIVCTDIACKHEYRVGCLKCLHSSHHGHMVVSLDKFLGILSDTQMKESENVMCELRDCITDIKEELECVANNIAMSNSFVYQTSREKINKQLQIFDYQMRLKKSDLIPLQRQKLIDLATTHRLFKLKTHRVFNCLNFFADIAYSKNFDTEAWESLNEGKIVSDDDDKMLEQEEQVEEKKIVRKQSTRKGRRKSKKNKQQFIFTQAGNRSIQHDGKVKYLWRVVEEKEKIEEISKELDKEGVKVEQQEKQMGGNGGNKEEKEEKDEKECDLHKETLQKKKKKIAARKRCLLNESSLAGEKDLDVFEETHRKKKRKLNQTTSTTTTEIDVESRLEDQSRETSKEDIREFITQEQKLEEGKETDQENKEQVNKKGENKDGVKDDWIDDSDQSESLESREEDEIDEEYSGSDSEDEEDDSDEDGNVNSTLNKPQELEAMLVEEKQQSSNITHQLEGQESNDTKEEDSELLQSQTSTSNSTQLKDIPVSDQPKDSVTDGTRPISIRKTASAETDGGATGAAGKSNVRCPKKKSKYSQLRWVFLNEFMTLSYYNRSTAQNNPKCMLKYRYVGPKNVSPLESIYFEEYFQESYDPIVLDQHAIIKEAHDFINWIKHTFLPIIREKTHRSSQVMYSSSPSIIPHVVNEKIRQKILCMTFISKDIFLTMGQNSEIKLWQINQLTQEMNLIQKTSLEVSAVASKVIISTNARNFLLSGELYSDRACSLFGMNFSTNKTQLLKSYKARSGNVDTPFTGLLLMDKFVVIQKRNSFTRIGLFQPQTKKYIKNYVFLHPFDNVSMVARSRSLLALSSQISSRIGVLDLVSGREVFLSLPTQGDYYIFAGYGFQNIRGDVYYAVSLTLNTNHSPLEQVFTNVPVTGKIYENEQENAMFRFEIYKLIDQQNEPNWSRVYMKYGEIQVIQVQYCPLLDELIMLEGYSSKNFQGMSFFGCEEEVEMRIDAKIKGFEMSRFNIEKKSKRTLLN